MKERLLLIILAFFCLTFQTQGQSLQPGHMILGDANGDGVVNVADIVEVNNYILGQPSATFNISNADTNYDGIVDYKDVERLTSIITKPRTLEYEYCTFEDDGVDAILTDNGLFAVYEQTPDKTGYILTTGSIESDLYSCILVDSLGFVQGIKTSDNRTFNTIYTPDGLWLVDPDGNLFAEIPYSEFEDETDIKSLTRAWEFQRTPIYKALSTGYKIKSYAKDKFIAVALDLLEYVAKGDSRRYGELYAKVLKTCLNMTDIIGWIELLQKLDEIYFFGNATLTTLDADKNAICKYMTPCKVEGLSQNNDAFKGEYEKVINYTYTLKMTIDEQNAITHEFRQSDEQIIKGDGVYKFNWHTPKLQTSYEYEPSLTLEITYITHVDKEELERAMRYAVINMPYNDFNVPKRSYIKKCTIYGEPKSFLTGTVSSKVTKVDNVEASSANIICTFSEVPDDAECEVYISKKGSDFLLSKKAEHDTDTQVFTFTGLSYDTEYVATTSISYNERIYEGENIVEFKTKASGEVELCPDNNHPHLIDLGLPSGIKWSCCDYRATKPEDVGAYRLRSEIPARVDSEVIPSLSDVNEMASACEHMETTINGVKGALYTSKNNGNMLFFPYGKHSGINGCAVYWCGETSEYSFAEWSGGGLLWYPDVSDYMDYLEMRARYIMK